MLSGNRPWNSMLVAFIAVAVVTGAFLTLPYLSRAKAEPTIGPVLWTFNVDPDTGQPLSSGNKLSGVGEVCASIPYRGLTPGTEYEYEWYHNGLLIKHGHDSVETDAGYIVQCHHWMIGAMELVLQVGDLEIRSAPVVIEHVKSPGDDGVLRCGPLEFSGAFTQGDDYTATGGSRFVQGTNDINARWKCYNAPVGSPYRVTWLENGKPMSQTEDVFDQSDRGYYVPMLDQQGAAPPAGTYRMVLDVAGQVVLAGELVVEGFGGFTAQPYYGQPAFATEFDEIEGRPLNAAFLFDRGVSQLFMFWPYRDAQVSTPVRVTWYHDGDPFSVSESVLDSVQGLFWSQTSGPDDAPLEPGTYRAVVEIDGQTVLASDCTVSSQPREQKQFGPISFASALDETTEEPLDPGTEFHYGIRTLYALWPYRDVTPGTPFIKKWYVNEELLSENQGSLSNSEDTMWNSLAYNDGMPLKPGPYMIQIEIQPSDGAQQWLYGRCMIAEPAEPAYGPVVFSSDFNEDSERPVDPDTRFSYGTQRLWAYWVYREITVDTPFSYAWFRDGASIAEGQGVLTPPSGKAWQSVFNDDGIPLEKGLYTFNVTIDGAVVIAEQCRVE